MLLVKLFLQNERGATAVEYGLMVSLIVIAAMGAISTTGGGIAGVFDRTTTAFDEHLSPSE